MQARGALAARVHTGPITVRAINYLVQDIAALRSTTYKRTAMCYATLSDHKRNVPAL